MFAPKLTLSFGEPAPPPPPSARSAAAVPGPTWGERTGGWARVGGRTGCAECRDETRGESKCGAIRRREDDGGGGLWGEGNGKSTLRMES